MYKYYGFFLFRLVVL